MVQTFWERVWQCLIKLGIHLPHDPAISLLDEMKIYVLIKNLCMTVYSHFIHDIQKLETIKISLHWEMWNG